MIPNQSYCPLELIKKLIILILFTFILCGCVSRKAILNKPYETKTISLSYKIQNIEIIEERDSVTSERISIPTVSFPGQTDKVFPKLTPRHQQIITSQLKKYFSIDGDNIKIKCLITNGFKEFIATIFNEQEHVQFGITLELLNMDNQVFKSCSSSAFYHVKSMDAKYKFIDSLYQKAIKHSIYKCVEKLNDL